MLFFLLLKKHTNKVVSERKLIMKMLIVLLVSDTYDYAVPDISGSSCNGGVHQPLLGPPPPPAPVSQYIHGHHQVLIQPKLPSGSPPSLMMNEIDTLASSSGNSASSGHSSASVARRNNNNQLVMNEFSPSPIKKVL